MSSSLDCTLVFTALALMTWSSTLCAGRITYPAYHVVQRKADPFVALTHTLRQQDLQQQQQQMGAGNPNAYYVDYPTNFRQGAAPLDQPTQDDIYRFEQLQRELGRAAFMPFYGRAQRTAWGQVMPEEGLQDDDNEQLPQRPLSAADMNDEDDNGYGYGIPVGGVVLEDNRRRPPQMFQQNNRMLEEEGLGGDWYDTAVVPAAPFEYERAYDEQQRQQELLEQQDRENQEAQVLLDTLTEYMLMYGNGPTDNQVAQQEVEEDDDEERELMELEQSKRAGSRGHHQKQQVHVPAVVTTTTTTTPSSHPAVAATAAATTAPVVRHGGITVAAAHHQVRATVAPATQDAHPAPMDRQPPVQHSANGDSLGQKEFPMMRPASAQRPKWLDTYKTQHGLPSSPVSGDNTKRHHHSSKTKISPSIVTSEDELIEELDNLKTKKN